ncbi:hypothetical protein BDZ45DRAFT_71142 [Acephala macrosclerotiorum]|nr:hypothetical protein BDZ45DRAFT_71142 [Acephala macrosclerotiorum]
MFWFAWLHGISVHLDSQFGDRTVFLRTAQIVTQEKCHLTTHESFQFVETLYSGHRPPHKLFNCHVRFTPSLTS